jgi:hypothetical protein
LLAFPACAQERFAFEGAEGFGRNATGGRGGKVYIVTNLNDDGPGSFREAVRKKGPRMILFGVSGNIDLKSSLSLSHGDVTIAGQSAPGDGICLRNFQFNIDADNVIIRFMRFRLGDKQHQEADALSGRGARNVIIDHCSISWATDECASFYRNHDFTLQWCIISESLNSSVHHKGEHGYGGIWGGEGASFHHNLLAHHNSRLPRFSGSSTTPNPEGELVDFRNNVIYNWQGNSTYGGEKGRYNMVNNYYKPGPATKHKHPWMVNPSSPYGQFFIAGNTLQGNTEATVDNWKAIKAEHPDSARVTRAFDVTAVQIQPVDQAFELVLHKAGASYRRDAVDQRVVQEVREGKAPNGAKKNGIIDSQDEVGGWPELKSSPAPQDADADGMPDAWETQHKLNPQDAADAMLPAPGSHYVNLEVYLQELVRAGL